MNHWLQRKLFQCLKCGATYVHDRGYAHQLFLCPKQKQPVKR